MEEVKNTILSIVDTSRSRRALPDTTETTGSTRGYVNYGKDNNFPNFVNELYEECSTLRSIIDGTAEYIQGNGVLCSEKWETVNRKGTTIEDFVLQIATDLLKFDGFAIQVVYSRLNAVAELYALEFSRCRVSPDGKKVFYAKSWGTYTSKYEEYDSYRPGDIDPNKRTQIFYYKGAHRTYYPYPKWQGAFRDVLSEIEASKYVLTTLSNGLNVKSVITLPNNTGLLTPDEKKAVEKSIQEKFTGPDAESSFMLFWREEGMDELSIDSIKSEDETERFNAIKKSARENIFVAFRAAPILCGLTSEMNTGFSTNEFNDQFNLYNRTMVRPKQKKIMDVLQKITGDFSISIIPFTIETE